MASQLTDQLRSAGHLTSSDCPGVQGTSEQFEAVVSGLSALISRRGADAHRTRIAFPPIMPRKLLDAVRYVDSFPQLVGSIHCFSEATGDYRGLISRPNGAEWSVFFEASDVVLTPAACHPVYHLCAGRRIEGGSLKFDVASHCFRNEAADEGTRLRSFRMHELVDLGLAEAAMWHRDGWLDRLPAFFAELGLNVRVVPATDAFFGAGSAIHRARQERDAAKFEIVARVDDRDVAIASANYHDDFFTSIFDIAAKNGAPTASACVAFGLERICLALFERHGLDTSGWPGETRTALGL